MYIIIMLGLLSLKATCIIHYLQDVFLFSLSYSTFTAQK